jgi:hypothetical protein
MKIAIIAKTKMSFLGELSGVAIGVRVVENLVHSCGS